MKILIVDDHSSMRRLIRTFVNDLAETVHECGDGAGAVATYAAERFTAADRVLMDIELPGMDGLETTQRLRTAFPDARVIIVTQFGDAHLRAAAAAAGASDYVRKDNLLELRRLLQSP